MLRATLVDQIVRPAGADGCDWGAERVVLARLLDAQGRPVKELWWHRSRKCWTGRLSGYTRIPAELCMAQPTAWAVFKMIGDGHCSTKALHKGGRLSAALLKAHAEKIDEFFGESVARLLYTKQTLIIEGIAT